jgi:predicted dehydrogenase
MTQKRLRVGFLSAVRHAVPYAEILGENPAVEIVGIAEEPEAPDWMRMDSRAAAFTVGATYTEDAASLLTPDAVDAVVICSEPTRHARLARSALAAGLHVLIDKPAATSLADIDALVKAERTSIGTLSVINRLRSQSIRRLRRWVDAGHCGLPLHVDVEWFASGAHFATSVERPELVVDEALSGGGEILNFLLYPVDYIRYLTGLNVVEVHCEAGALFSSLHEEAGVEDSAVLSLLLENGVTATVTLGRIPAAPGLGPVSTSVRLLGSHGNASADDDKPAVSLFGTDGGVSALPVGGPSSVAILTEFLNGYVSDLLNGRMPEYSISDARHGIAVSEAAYSSAESGQPVRI